MTWTFTIPEATPSLNTIQGRHWAANHRDKEALQWVVASALNKVPRIPPATGPRRLTITRHGKGRLDRDNLTGGAKFLIDEIKRRRLILDDNPDVCELVVLQVVDRKTRPHTVVELEDVA